MKNPTLPPGASSETAIALAIPTPTNAMKEVLVRWHKASVPQSLDGYYAMPGIDPDMRQAFHVAKEQHPDGYEEQAKAFGLSAEKTVEILKDRIEAGTVVIVLHNSKPIHNGATLDLKGMKKQVSLYASDVVQHFALATLDDRTKTMQEAVAQLFVMFGSDLIKDSEKEP